MKLTRRQRRSLGNGDSQKSENSVRVCVVLYSADPGAQSRIVLGNIRTDYGHSRWECGCCYARAGLHDYTVVDCSSSGDRGVGLELRNRIDLRRLPPKRETPHELEPGSLRRWLRVISVPILLLVVRCFFVALLLFRLLLLLLGQIRDCRQLMWLRRFRCSEKLFCCDWGERHSKVGVVVFGLHEVRPGTPPPAPFPGGRIVTFGFGG
ncbi:unnamed protein product [Mycena citricolor]|uniref:Uncharacterized protein n=1 Tax=Mycena citricolor TaxID=2018698 RepID=A0AAD2H187_9AGAR|nr:unnamed protein product [Mycena citricolor]